MNDFTRKLEYNIADLLQVTEILRAECPWDREQTHESLRDDLLEEAREVVEAIDQLGERNGEQHFCEELGDVLFNIILQAQIASERRAFDFDAVCNRIVKKLVYRHPHVFGSTVVKSTGEVLENWAQLKAAEKAAIERGDDPYM
jgi:uncharacterized protein YabN with tetrapyrrole methylase and pyrophosphatase domain